MRPSATELRKLYLDEKLSSCAIGDRFGVSHTSVLRWLKAGGISRRAVGRGLNHRGITAPTKDALNTMVHVEHLTYDEIAAIYTVDPSAIPHWLDKAGLPRSVRPRVYLAPEILARYKAGETPEGIASALGVSRAVPRRVLADAGITPRRAGFNGARRYFTSDGTEVRSSYEKRAADWLIARGVAIIYEPPLPFRRFRADFLVNGWYVEIWGVQKSKRYAAKRDLKRRLYTEHNLPLIELDSSHFSKARRPAFEHRMARLLTTPLRTSGPQR